MRPEKPIKRIDQVCVVVRDLQKTREHYWTHLGIGPWKIYLFEEILLREMTIKGKHAKYSMHVAICEMENILIELIQPLAGDTIYREHLEQKGEGLHHLGLIVENLDLEIERFETGGIGTLQTGRFQEGGFAYLDTQEKFGTILELIERSKARNTPIRVWPESEDT
jgi:methylmalonyl-CoA/ethylmalonyl-CoA epimerase